ncbi:hypothetical protein V3471_05985 [Flavobacterium oreochromis]|uniref:hypothetical protein n=1 Tax=Flavobacterium oreochromis TaxID=2906078 RepID=UPI00385C0D4C
MKNNFLNTLYHLRTVEHLILYEEIFKIPSEDCDEVIDFLEDEYHRESIDYPYQVPPFDKEAALWAAKTVYLTTQFLLCRANTIDQLKNSWIGFDKKITAGAMLSADLCLRFLPQLFLKLEEIDSGDILVDLLKIELQKFYYSSVGFRIENLKIEPQLLDDPCMKQMLLDRIYERNDSTLGRHSLFKEGLEENFGDYKEKFWKEL